MKKTDNDLESDINNFLSDGVEVKDIKFSVSCSVYSDDKFFVFSAMILYESKADSSK